MFGETHKLVLRYNLGAMALYIEDNGVETFCTSFSNALGSYFLMITGAAMNRSSLSIDINSLDFQTKNKNDIQSMVIYSNAGRR